MRRRPGRRELTLRRAGVHQRQVKGEGAAGVGLALEADLAAEQVRELATDGEAAAGPSVFAARAGVRLLERFEDQLLLLQGDADPGVGHDKDDRRGSGAEHWMV